MGSGKTRGRTGKRSPNYAPMGKPRKSVFKWLCLSILLFIAAAAMSIYIACGCLYNDDLYIVQLKSNDTVPVRVRLGYLGTCVSLDGDADDESSNRTACIAHINYDNDQPLADQFADELQEKHVTINAQDLNNTLGELLSLTETLQEQVFPSGIPISFLVLFLLSTIFYWLLSASPSSNKAYKFAFALTTILNAYGLMLGFMLALSTLQACKGLKFPATGENEFDQLGVYIKDLPRLQYLQWATCAICVLEQISIAVLFIRHSAHRGGDAVVTILPLYIPFRGKGKRRCC
ncbi:hypothetical protein PFICI_02487 [Pestalotiopsis fici W106-1]|uniref:Uncharacterized protein n=1 Tax=Pestalotiopsis fici (strain W106-1 / CGMCC3.15140) TaxID=1229662 RepID=W3XGA6_PESFW|nr:uncharacterized protein PFICI_02487 [Pestalotiopsis fici W106-1]ETS84462.1 hypothetical protein PFICI_02487 [Pestalotiopsis fici W106-1]